ncbi:hypothetical protein VZQ01_06710 [Myxococcus faecalis]|uniref:hypothetical protein n=1 Tax=Myxococcus faecalis TaxID=3115646 RepID=UPI003CF044D8
MDSWTQRVALAQRLGAAERRMQVAIEQMDGSPESRMRYARARAEYRAAEDLALVVLGAREALALVEEGAAQPMG